MNIQDDNCAVHSEIITTRFPANPLRLCPTTVTQFEN